MNHCACGCGQLAARRFIKGHNRRRPVEYTVLDNGCWLWAGALQNRGYGTIRRDGRNYKAHRWMYEQLVGPIPEGLQLDHLCRNRACVNPAHLEPVTNAENVQRGKRAKLTTGDVAEIRQSDGTAATTLAARFGVTTTTIARVRRGEAWVAA